jgi:flagellar hook-length control protein FliK
METLPIRNTANTANAANAASSGNPLIAAAPANAAAATVSKSATSNGDAAADATTDAVLKPFSALLALQLNGMAPAEPKSAAPATDADGDSAAATIAATATDALAGLNLPAWPPTIAVLPNAAATPNARGNLKDIVAGGRSPLVATDQYTPPRGVADTPVSPRGKAETIAAAHADANPHGSEAADLAALAAHAGEKAVHATDSAANIVAPPLQSTAPAASAAPAQAALAAPVGTAEWNSELGQKIVWMIGDRQQTAELHINPPELGPLDIKLTIDGQSTSAVFTSPHSAVREALESALPRLREVLADSGLTLGNASVTADTPRDGRAYAGQQPSARRDDNAAGDTVAAPVITRITTGVRGLVDFFA